MPTASDFYVGQSATVFIDGFAGTLTGTVTAVSSSSAAVSTGVPLTTVRVRLTNPGLVTSDYTASAVIGSYIQLRPGTRQGGGQQRHHGGGLRQGQGL